MRAYLEHLSSELLEFMRGALRPPGSFVAGEETLTENLLVGLKAASPSTFVIQKPSRAVESREGHDFVWTLRSRFGYGTFRVQAKKLYPSGKYEVLNHHYLLPPNGVELQLERLIRTSRILGHAPIYAFYNADHGDFAQSSVTLGACCRVHLQRRDPSRRDYSPVAVTLADAHWVRAFMTPASPLVPPVPTTKDLNGAALPWECLLGCRFRSSTGSAPLDPSDAPTGGHESGPSPKIDDPTGAGSPPDGTSDRAGRDSPPEGVTGPDYVGELGLVPHRSSYLRKLAWALQTGEQTETLVGFSRDEPSWLAASAEDPPVDDEGGFFKSLEPDLDDEERPAFYVFSDVRQDS
jgi:hypothetical protein